MDKKYANHFRRKPANGKNSLKKQKKLYLIHSLSDKAFKATVVNRALPSLHGGLLEITLTVPVEKQIKMALINHGLFCEHSL